MATTYSGAIAEAFDRDDPRSSVDSIKATIINEIHETDSRVSIKKTEYFNHTYVPDLVLNWPDEKIDRFLYLRTDPSPEYIAEDVEVAQAHHPIFFALSPLIRERQREFGVQLGDLDTSMNKSGSLVTDVTALEELIERRKSTAVVGLVSSAVLQGGRGVVGRDAAATVASLVSEGFNGAKRLDRESTGAAVGAILSTFDRVRSSRLTRFLNAVWVGSGGDASRFPASTDFSMFLDDAALQFLLDLEEIADDDFWYRIGRDLTVERISRLEIPSQPSTNLQRLIQNSLDILLARTCRVVKGQSQLFAQARSPAWVIEGGMLALRMEGLTAYLANRQEDLRVVLEESDGISISELRTRAMRFGIRVGQLQLATSRRNMSYGSSELEDITDDQELEELSRVLGPEVEVTRATAFIAGRRQLHFDFATRTASGRTASRFPCSDLLRAGISILSDLTSSEIETLKEITSYARQGTEQGFLFDSNMNISEEATSSGNLLATATDGETGIPRE